MDCLRDLTRKDFQTKQEVRWCPGCGDYAILTQIQKLLPTLGIPRERFVFVSGIGCSSRFPYYINTFGFHGIHGRAPAIAMGVKAANPDLSVWVVTGDGDGLSIGTNHLIHCLRRNIDINILLFNNRIYGLTKGQYSPTSEFGKVTKSSPLGTIEHPVRPIQMALAAEATFVARTVAADPAHMAQTLEAAARHKGASFIEILQNCRVFNDGTFDQVNQRKNVDDRIILEHGKPVRFGPNGSRGVVVRNMQPEIVEIAPATTDVPGLLVHDERADSPALAALLAALEPPQFPTALGVFRAREEPTYEEMMVQQIEAYQARRGPGDLRRLFASGATWQID
ncbi:MAG: 2-oxoacid:ferredoxin oxidoreductase subunit beta [Verrucomicrobiales bacterium]|nr:2-oxoacid:ferredoxin oxidoreductase subunit beta [Verrucomicrobiales bacterium]MCP5525999.1 2-oxoacid:ferredoxin oxidoreductase subunit beta [Verrucomicrobiales bacterium]